MLQIRKSVFETNSSSTHAICISKKEVDREKIRGKKIHFELHDFGWEFSTEANVADYLYTGICSAFKREMYEEYLGKLKEILDKHGVEYEFEEPKWDEDGWLHWDCASIDHGGELFEPLKEILNDEELVLSLLFNSESYVATGNDNSDLGEDYDYLLGKHEKELEETHKIFWK